MKRDMDIIRLLLLTLEGVDDVSSILSEYDVEGVSYNAAITIEAGLAHGHIAEIDDGGAQGYLTRLTWDGHDFLDSVRDPGVWSNVKDAMLKVGGAVSFGMVCQLGRMYAVEKLKQVTGIDLSKE